MRKHCEYLLFHIVSFINQLCRTLFFVLSGSNSDLGLSARALIMAPFHLPAARDTAVADVDTTPADGDDAGSIAGDSYTSSDAAGPSSSAVAARRNRDPTPTITFDGMVTERVRAPRNSEPEV